MNLRGGRAPRVGLTGGSGAGWCAVGSSGFGRGDVGGDVGGDVAGDGRSPGSVIGD